MPPARIVQLVEASLTGDGLLPPQYNMKEVYAMAAKASAEAVSKQESVAGSGACEWSPVLREYEQRCLKMYEIKGKSVNAVEISQRVEDLMRAEGKLPADLQIMNMFDLEEAALKSRLPTKSKKKKNSKSEGIPEGKVVKKPRLPLPDPTLFTSNSFAAHSLSPWMQNLN